MVCGMAGNGVGGPTAVDWPEGYPGEDMRQRFEHEVRLIRDHLTWAAERLDEPVSRRSTVESAIHVRIVLETLMLSSLILHGDALQRADSALRKLKPSEAIAAIRRLHPQFWPQPYFVNTANNGLKFQDRLTTGFMTEQQAGQAFGLTSDIVHGRNPLREPLDVEEAHRKLSDAQQLLAVLTQTFTVDLRAEGIGFYCWLDEANDPKGEGRLVRHFREVPMVDWPSELGSIPQPGDAPGIDGFVE